MYFQSFIPSAVLVFLVASYLNYQTPGRLFEDLRPQILHRHVRHVPSKRPCELIRYNSSPSTHVNKVARDLWD
jgi:hypothetical protein